MAEKLTKYAFSVGMHMHYHKYTKMCYITTRLILNKMKNCDLMRNQEKIKDNRGRLFYVWSSNPSAGNLPNPRC